MITRIEIDGFKLDVPPFLALVGPDSSGKSNLFDAVEFDKESFLELPRALLTSRRGRPHELFHQVAKGEPVERFEIAINRMMKFANGYGKVTMRSGAHLEDGRPVEDDFREPREDLFDEADIDVIIRALNKANTLFYVPDPQAMRGLASSADLGPLREEGGGLGRPVIALVPVRETEAWLLADRAAWVTLRGSDLKALPRLRDIEKVADPKPVLDAVVPKSGSRGRDDFFEYIGQNIDLAVLADVPAYADGSPGPKRR